MGKAVEDGRTPSGERYLGMPVAAWMAPAKNGGTEFATHWSTLREDKQTRLFSEHDVAALLAKVEAAERQAAILAGELEESGNRARARYEFAEREKVRAEAAEAQVQADRKLIEEAAKVLTYYGTACDSASSIPAAERGDLDMADAVERFNEDMGDQARAVLPRLLSRLHEDGRAGKGMER